MPERSVRMPAPFLVGLALAYLASCLPDLTEYTYLAEVGYYLNDQQTWFAGNDTGYEGRMTEALGRHNALAAGSPKRTSSRACRGMHGRSSLERVRSGCGALVCLPCGHQRRSLVSGACRGLGKVVEENGGCTRART
jgi:hypothetical protein